MKKNFLVSILLLTLCLVLVGCGKDDGKTKKEPTIIGKWANSGFVYTFNEDKTCSYDVYGTIMKCTYEIDGDKISILYDGSTASFDTTYSIDGDKLNIIDSFGEDTIYDRQA